MAIKSFSDTATKEFFLTGKVRRTAGWQSVSKVAQRKLDMICYASVLDDLKSPPGNKLERLKKNPANYHSIRINDQWRIIFRWTDAGAEDVRI